MLTKIPPWNLTVWLLEEQAYQSRLKSYLFIILFNNPKLLIIKHMGNLCQNPHQHIYVEKEIVYQNSSLERHQDFQDPDIIAESKIKEIHHQQIKIKQPEKQIQLPKLLPEVQQTLIKHKFFAEELQNHQIKRIRQKDGVYEGPLNQREYPHGFGKIYKNNGEMYIGQFSNGKIQGTGVHILYNGSYYKGQFKNNKANCKQGFFQSPFFKYSGGIKDNVFEGKGTQEGEKYIFSGRYVNGKRSNGKLIWRDQNGFTYFYTGSFDQNQNFHGKGTLVQNKGTYQGDFVHGVKQGNGYYKGVNGLKYKGTYKNGMKQGFGIIYNCDQTIAYKGNMKEGLPHGKGQTYIDGKVNEGQWIDGIDKELLQQMQKHQS